MPPHNMPITHTGWLPGSILLGLGLSLALAGSAPGTVRAAGITVTALDDTVAADGQCTLREALANAQADSALHVDCAAGAGHDTIGFALSGVVALQTPLPAITSAGGALTIDGAGKSVTISGGASLRPFVLGSGATVTLARFTITGGFDADVGGALLNGGNLTLESMQFTGNAAAAGGGGAIANLHGAQLVVNGGLFSANSALLGGGAILNGVGPQPGAAASLVVTGGVFSANTAGQDPTPWGNGGAVVNQGVASFTGTLFEVNHASHDGGAIYNRGPLTLADATLRGNTVLDSGGALKNNGGVVMVTGTTFNGNNAQGEGGGGFSQDSGSLTLANSTLSSNQAGATGEGGAVLVLGGSMTLVHATIAGNSAGFNAGAGGGLRNRTGSGVSLTNSLVAGNSAPAGSGPDCSGVFGLGGPVMFTQTSGCTLSGTPPLVGNPLLGPLAANGGPNQTHLLLPGSPALNAGDSAVCGAPPAGGVDQRGAARPFGSGCELGATEANMLGGSGFALSTPSVVLSWSGGNAAAAWHVLRLTVSPAGPEQVFGPLPAGATSATDGSAVAGTIYCYLALATDSGGVLGNSDVLCTQLGLRSGSLAPPSFAATLGGAATATVSWSAPAGGVSGYTLLVVPGDGSPPTTHALSGDATSTTYATGGGLTCFLLFAIQAAPPEVGNSDLVCALPGVSTLPAGWWDRLPGIAAAVATRALTSAAEGLTLD